MNTITVFGIDDSEADRGLLIIMEALDDQAAAHIQNISGEWVAFVQGSQTVSSAPAVKFAPSICALFSDNSQRYFVNNFLRAVSLALPVHLIPRALCQVFQGGWRLREIGG